MPVSYCKECHKSSSRKSWLAHREEHKEYMRGYNRTEAVHQQKFHYRHSERGKQKAQAWLESGGYEKRREGGRRYRQSPGGQYNGKLRYYAKKAGSPVVLFAPGDWADLLEEYGYSCAYCGKKGVQLTQDHVVPISRGGAHTKDNIVPACKSCNCSKKGLRFR